MGRLLTHQFAHKADILRLEILLEHGGIYLDIDTFVLRPFADRHTGLDLMQYDTVLGMEARALEVAHGPRSDDEMRPKGLCNAVIVARPGADFLQLWLQSYDTFRDSKWTEHSVVSASERLRFWLAVSTDTLNTGNAVDARAPVPHARDRAV
jgi:mannosyltransferase OCH1-like enzyme